MAVDGFGHMTKTQHYRKITKPLLERKRRARMNLYLDELKSLIVDTMVENEEHANKLEKAEILEMTVNYLKIQQHQRAAEQVGPGKLDLEKFRAGYTQAAYEVSKLFATLPGVDVKFSSRLLRQLGHSMKAFRSHELRHSRQFDSQNVYSGACHLSSDQQSTVTEAHSRELLTSNTTAVSTTAATTTTTATTSTKTEASHNEAALGTENVWRPW